MQIKFSPIGIIKTPFISKEGMPIQPGGAEGIKGEIEIFPEFVPGLADLDGFSHIILLYHFHESNGFDLKVKPFLDKKQRGVFSTRAPKRPNPIGLSVVKLIEIRNNILVVENIDILDKTPLMDIKPYIPAFDIHKSEKYGWIENRTKDLDKIKSDNRFR